MEPARWQCSCRRSHSDASPARPPRGPCADVANKFASTAWGKKLAARSAKAAMTDFDRCGGAADVLWGGWSA